MTPTEKCRTLTIAIISALIAFIDLHRIPNEKNSDGLWFMFIFSTIMAVIGFYLVIYYEFFYKTIDNYYSADTRVHDFLSKLYKLIEEDNKEDESYLIYDTFDRLMQTDDFDIINKILEDVDINKLQSYNIRSFLVTSGWAKDKLPARDAFYDRVYPRMVELRGEETAKKLIEKLK